MKPTRKTNAALLAEIEDLQARLAEAQNTLQAGRSFEQEITGHKHWEERVLRLTSLYAVLSKVNEAIVRTDDEESLCREVCRIVAEEGGFPLVWIGQATDRRVVPEAWSGPAEDYLKQIKVETEGKLGQGPTGTCIRENRPIVNDDFTTNPATSPWKEAALRYGFRASAAFPLRRGGKAVGALTLYAPQPGVFDAEQVALLESLSADVSYALDALDQEQLRIRAEQSLREAHERATWLARFPEENPNPVLRVSADGSVLYRNPAAAKLPDWECKVGQLLGDPLLPLVRQAMTEGREAQQDIELGRRSYAVWAAPFPAEGYANVYGRDVTERKQAEEAVLRAKEQWERTFDSVPDLIAILDDKHRIVRVNKAMAQRLGTTADQCVGQPCYRCVHGTARPPAFCPHSQTVADSREHTVEVHEDRLGGDFIVSTTPLLDEQGGHIGSVHVARDITERKAAEQALLEANERLQMLAEELTSTNEELRVNEEQLLARSEELKAACDLAENERLRLEAVMQALPIGVAITDAKGGNIRSNDAFEQVWGGPAPATESVRDYAVYKAWWPDTGKSVKPGEWASARAVRKGESIVGQVLKIRRFDGSDAFVINSASPVRDARGKIIGSAVAIQDITDLRKAEEAIKESEERLRLAVECTQLGTWDLDLMTGRLDWSPRCREIFGLSPDVLLDYQTFLDGLHPDDRRRVNKEVEKALDPAGSGSFETEYRTCRPDGTERWIIAMGRTSFGTVRGRRRAVRFVGTALDVTERKRTEALRLANSYNRSLIEASLDPLVTIGPDGKITDVNSATELATGCAREELIGTDFSDYFTEPDKARAGYRQVFQEGLVRDYPLELRHRDGRIASVLYHASVYRDEMGNPVGVFAAARDITRRKRGEEALRRANSYNRSLIEASLDPLVTIGPDGKITDVNAATEQVTGCTREELIGTDFSGYFTEPDKAQAGYRQVFQEGSVRDYPLELRHHDGHITSVLYHASVYRDEMGNPVGVFAAARDITAWKQAEEAVKIERQRLYDVMETLPVYVVLLSKDYHVPFANRFFRERFGESNGKRCFEYLFNRNEPCEICETYKVLKTHAPLGWEWTGPDGRNYDIHDFPFTDTDGSPMIMEMGIDVTERKRAEAALREANETLERRASQLQRLTMELSQAEDRERHRLAQILHDDLQQSLVGAKLHLNILANKIHAGESKDAKALLSQVRDLIGESIDKSRSLSHELAPPLLYQATLGDALTWLGQQMEQTYGLTVEVDAGAGVDLSSDALKAFAYKAAQEMLFNVVKHARVKRAKLQLRRLKEYVRLVVSDEGKGFDVNTLGRAGGFGLFSIQERSRLLGGWMKFKSTPGAGSVFVLAVPDAKAPAAAETAVPPADQQAVARLAARTRAVERETNHPLRVLLVDDHKVMREGVAALLEEQPDIEVVGQAGNGRDAISMTRKLQPDVIVMDVAMPILGGEEATRRIKSHWPRTRVIALSLSEETIVGKKMRKAGAECYLSKTDPAEKLLAAIRGRPSS